jgi:hypothetical protein
VANNRGFTLRGTVHRFPSGSFANRSTSRRLIHHTPPCWLRVTDRSPLGSDLYLLDPPIPPRRLCVRPTFIVDNVACPDGYALPELKSLPGARRFGERTRRGRREVFSIRPRPPGRK